MFKIAFFVEGVTEQLFVERYVTKFFQEAGLEIVTAEVIGGGAAGERIFKNWRVRRAAEGPITHYVQIACCTNHERVTTDIRERYGSLVASGFSEIIGFRDVYPEYSNAEVAHLRSTSLRYLPAYPVVSHLILGVMEIESWFLTEHTHLTRLDPRLTPEFIQTELGFNPQNDDLQILPHPCQSLKDTYRLVGKGYTKSAGKVRRVIDILDLDRMRAGMHGRLPDLDELNSLLKAFFSQDPENPEL